MLEWIPLQPYYSKSGLLLNCFKSKSWAEMSQPSSCFSVAPVPVCLALLQILEIFILVMKKSGREGKYSLWGLRAFQNCMKQLGIWRHLLLSAFPGGFLLSWFGMVLVIPVCWSVPGASGDGGSLWIPPCWQWGTMPDGIAPVVSWQSLLPSPRGGHFIKDEESPL